MKKNLKKLSLNKDIVSNLAEKTKGGRIRQVTTDDPIDPIDPFTSTDPTKLTWCYHCPVNNPF